MKNALKCAALLLIITGLLTGCLFRGRLAEASDELGVSLSGGKILHSEDSHSGFQGDGAELLVIGFSGEKAAELEERLERSEGWKPLPMPESLAAVIYGDAAHSSLILSEEKIPAVKNGYWWFYDRHADSADHGDPAVMWGRASFNFTLAVYDADAGRLYYYRLDT